MKKLNNNGLTAIEVLVCFVIVSIIVVSMLNIVNNYKDKEETESYKNTIETYRNTVTKIIYDDILKNNGITNTNTNETGNENNFEKSISMTYASGRNASITIHNESKCIKYERDNTGKKNEIKNLECVDEIAGNIDYQNSIYYIEFTDSNGNKEKFPLEKIYNLKFNEIFAEEKNSGFINIHIGLWHTDLGTKYDVVNIITPNVTIYPGMLGQ